MDDDVDRGIEPGVIRVRELTLGWPETVRKSQRLGEDHVAGRRWIVSFLQSEDVFPSGLKPGLERTWAKSGHSGKV
jgi:hypothetical protein